MYVVLPLVVNEEGRGASPVGAGTGVVVVVGPGRVVVVTGAGLPATRMRKLLEELDVELRATKLKRTVSVVAAVLGPTVT